jgi:hypothetical protein
MSDLSGGTIHYRCAFDATCVNSAWADPYPDLNKRVRTWVEDTLQVPRDTLKNKKFLIGGNFKEECPPKTAFETISRNYNTQGLAPTYWGCRVSHPCSEFVYRRWTHDLTITCHKPNEFRIVLVTRHSISGYLGEEPTPPSPFVPGIVQSLTTTKHWRCTSGTENLNGKPIPLYPGHVSVMKDALLSKARNCPIVYVSCSNESGKPLIDVDPLAELLCGAAVVYVATTAEIDREVEPMLGEFGTRNGGIRVYQSGVNMDLPADGKRHRFFSPFDIRKFGTDEVTLQMVRACCRRASIFSPNDVTSIESIVNAARRRKLHELTYSSSSTIEPEFMELVQEMEVENAELLQSIAQVREELELVRINKEIESEDLQKEIARTKYQLASNSMSMDELYERNRRLEDSVGAVEAFRKLPSSLVEVLTMVCALNGDHLDYTKEAIESAHIARFGDLNKAWELLWAMAEILHPMLFESEIPFSDTEYKSKTGFLISMSEGRQTQRDTKLMQLRERQYQGRTIDITPHIGSGRSSDCLRVHFAVDQETRKLIIGHCGDHMDNSLTRKRS